MPVRAFNHLTLVFLTSDTNISFYDYYDNFFNNVCKFSHREPSFVKKNRYNHGAKNPL